MIIKDIKEAIANTADKAKGVNAVHAAEHKASEAAQQVGHNVTEAATAAVHRVQEIAEKIGDAASEFATQAVSKVSSP